VLFCWTNSDRNGGNATVYAFDADTLKVIWSRFIGLLAWWTTQAPAIDDTTNTMYFIYKADNDSGLNYVIAIDVMTGNLLPDSPKLINGTVAGTGEASVNGQLVFQNTGLTDRLKADCRTSILIVNQALYFGFAHNSDSHPYHGWVFSYKYDFSAKKFDQPKFFCITPNAGSGGVWQGGHGLASDGKYIYFDTGNGPFDPSKNSFAMAVMKMTLDLELVDYFVPAQYKQYSSADKDISGCGPILIPNSPYLFVGVTKYGSVHLINTNSMGKFNAQTDSCKQSISLRNSLVAPGGNPVVWSNGSTTKLYMWAQSLSLIQMVYNPSTQLIDLPLSSWDADKVGGELFVSSNGNSNAILWALSRNQKLYAFDASQDISAGPIWQSAVASPTSWGWPTVANGKVYVPCGNRQVSAFGLTK